MRALYWPITAGMILCVAASWVNAAENARQQQIERQQQQELLRQQQQLDDVFLPGPATPLPTPSDDGALTDAADASARCFNIDAVLLRAVNVQAASLLPLLQAPADAQANQCLSAAAIQALQRSLSNVLIEKGYVTSRILIPQQDLSSGTLRFDVVGGYLEQDALDGEGVEDSVQNSVQNIPLKKGIQAEGLSQRQAEIAVPKAKQGLLNLRDLEQGVENLNRLPGMQAQFRLLPGTSTGASTVVVSSPQGRRWQGSLGVTEKIYGSVAHGYINGAAVIANPLSGVDRLALSFNADVDDEVSDRAYGFGFSYDSAYGFWLIELAGNLQRYENSIRSVATTFDTQGYSGDSRLGVRRTVFRSRVSKISVGAFHRYDDVENEIDDVTVSVSSYRLHSTGIHLDASTLIGRYQLGGSFTIEQASAAGAAANLPGGGAIADVDNQRYKIFVSGLRDIPSLRSTLQIQLNGQHSDDRLFPVQRQTLTAYVPGYEDISRSGNSAVALSAEWSLRPMPLQSWAGLSMRPFVGPKAGWVLANNQQQFDRIASWNAGLAFTRNRMGLTMDGAWPWDQASTLESENEYVFRAAFNYAF